ncbi:peptidylprolyl isomerase [Palleronia sediminis]|uniref:Parvulin-like PPIase n=1 Tax=Palleronia sediminis TaxID=2547833 RepID=A0A4R6AA91_9RHOB|nr:peptidylprolyl isomerase [Palleronia sediminis]TDL78176.1 peptidylprolyl isomerase [Palleronia sediminis]
MSKFTTLTAAGAFALALAGAAPAQDQGASADTVLATVGDTEITLGHVIAMRARLPQQYQALDDAALFDGILEQLIQQTALGAQVDMLSPRNELVLENERRALVASEVLQAQADGTVTEEAIQKAYDAEYAGAEPQTQYNAAHILVETEQEAQALIEELEGGADFATLARENSVGPSGPSGGALGWFGPGAMVPAFDTAVQEMSAGEIAGPVETQFGWHVIKLNETRTLDAPPLDEVRGEIESQLQERAIQEAMQSAVEAADITRADSGIDPSVIRDDSLLDE